MYYFFLALRESRQIIMNKLDLCNYERTCREILNRFNIQELSLEANFSQVSNNILCTNYY